MTAAAYSAETARSRAWMRHGLCVTAHDPDLWFPETGQQKTAAEARAVCRACPVISDCLAYAIVLNIRHGVWGGTVPEERSDSKPTRRPSPVSPAARKRKTQAERERRRRLRTAAAAGDTQTTESLERERTRRRATGSPAAASEPSPKAGAAR